MKVPHHSAEQAIRKMGAAAQRRNRTYSVADVCGALSEEALPSNSRDCTGGAMQKLRLHQSWEFHGTWSLAELDAGGLDAGE